MMPAGRIVETDGLGANLMPVFCSWCDQSMGAKAWDRPAKPGEVTHGICPACRDRVFGALDFPAATNEAASLPKLSITEPSASAGETGTANSAGVMTSPQVVEHAGARPVASFTFNDRHGVPAGPIGFIDALLDGIDWQTRSARKEDKR